MISHQAKGKKIQINNPQAAFAPDTDSMWLKAGMAKALQIRPSKPHRKEKPGTSVPAAPHWRMEQPSLWAT